MTRQEHQKQISYSEVLPVNVTKMLFSTFFYLTFRLAIDARLHQKTAIQGESAPWRQLPSETSNKKTWKITSSLYLLVEPQNKKSV